MNDDGFAHSLRHVNGGAYRTYYLSAYQSWHHDAAQNSLGQCARMLHERAEGMSVHRGVHEAELVAAHVEVVSKELYAFVSRHPTDLPWSPTSAYTQLLSSCQSNDDSGAAARAPILQPSKSFSGTQLPCYRVHDELVRVAELPIRCFVKPETWEHRQSTMREFLTPPRMAIAQQVVEHLLRTECTPRSMASSATDAGGTSSLFGAEALASIEGFHQLSEDRFSFVHFGDGLFLHVWRVSSEARRLVSCAQKVWQTLFEHGMHPYGTLLTAVLFVKGVAVTFTQLPPLLPTDKLLACDRNGDACAATGVTKALAALIGSSYYARTTSGNATGSSASLAQLPNPRLQIGADGRYYFMYPMSFGVFPEEIGGVGSGGAALRSTPSLDGTVRASPLATPLRLDWYHVVLPHGTSHTYAPDTILDGIRRGPCAAAADAILRGVLPKLTDMVTQQVVASTMHGLGVNMRFLFLVKDQIIELASKYPPEAVQLAADAVVAEMLCRTVKVVLRAELSLALSGSRLVDYHPEVQMPASVTSDSLAGDDASSAGVAPLRRDVPTDRINRFMQWCAKGDPQLWDEQILPILRAKFLGCPSTFHLYFHAKYFKIFMWYLTPRFGAAYDAKTNAFSRLTQAGNPNSSFFFVPDVVKMHLSAQKSDEAALLIGTWWKAAEKLPVSTPLAWMERTLRLQRIASICVIMKHGSRLRFIDVCIGVLRAHDQPRHAVHRVMTALFQLMMMDEMEAAYLVRHPLYDIIVRTLRGLTAETMEAAWSDALGLPGALPSPSNEAENCHFLGYVLRSLGSNASVHIKGKSPEDAVLSDHIQHAAVLQLRWSLLALHDGSSTDRATLEEGGANGTEGRSKEARRRRSSTSRCNVLDPSIAVPIDVCCNAQLLCDLLRLDDQRVRCALVCNLARYAAPLPFLALDQCTPTPTYISAFHDCVRSLWGVEGGNAVGGNDDGEGGSVGMQHELLCMRLRTAWVVLGDVCGVPAVRQGDTYRLLGAPSSEPADPEDVYNNPHVVCSLMQCLACTLQLWMSNAEPLRKKDGFATLVPSQATQIVLDAQSLLALAYPAAAPESVAVCGGNFTPDAVQDVNDAIRSSPFANALAVVLEDTLIPRQVWRLALAVGRLLQYNTTIARRESIDTALQSLAMREAKATIIQRRLRFVAVRGRCAEAPCGSPEWHDMIRAKLERLNRQAFLYAVGMNLEAEQLFHATTRQELIDRAQIAYWGVLLEQEVAWSDLEAYRVRFEGTLQLQLLIAQEAMTRSEVIIGELASRAGDIWRASIEEEADACFDALQVAMVQGAAASLMDASESAARQTLYVEALDAWVSGCAHGCLADRFLIELVAMCSVGSRDGAMVREALHEGQQRWQLMHDALIEEAESCLPAWCRVAEHCLDDLVSTAANASLLMGTEEQEASQRLAMEVDALSAVACSIAYAWLADCVAPALYAAWNRVLWTGGGGSNCAGDTAELYDDDDSDTNANDAWYVSHLVVPVMRAYGEAYAMDMQRIAADSEAELQGAALQMLIQDEEPKDRRTLVEVCDAHTAAWLCEYAELHRATTVEAEHDGWCATMVAEEQHRLVVVPEMAQRNAAGAAADAAFLNTIVVQQAHHDMVVVALQWVAEAEALHRWIYQTAVTMRRPMLFSRPFILAPETSTDVPRQEVKARMLLLQAYASGARQAFAAEHHRALRGLVELQAMDQRSQLRSEESATRLQWSSEIDGCLLNARIASLSAGEHTARWTIAGAYVQALREWCLQRHGLDAEALHHAYWCDGGPAYELLAAREAIFREDARRKHAQWMRGVVLQAAILSFDATEREWRSAACAMEAMVGLSTKVLRGRGKLAEEEATARGTLRKLESLMHGIASNQFHAQHKTLLRPSQRALLSMQRRMQRQRQLAVPSPTKHQLLHHQSSNVGVGVAHDQHRMDMLMTMETTQRDHLGQHEERTREMVASYRCRGHSDSGGFEALERLLQTPPWDQPTMNLLGSDATTMQFSSVLQGSGDEVASFMDGTLMATPMDPLEAPTVPPFVSLMPPHQEEPQDFLKYFRSLVAEEVVARECTTDDEKLARSMIAADEREIIRFFRDPAFLNYRPWIAVLPCMSHLYWALREDRELSKDDALLEHNCKKLVTQLRSTMRGMLEGKTVLTRQEHTAAMLLRQREQLDRQRLVLAMGVKNTRKSSSLSIGARDTLPTPTKGGLANSNVAASASSIAARRNPLLGDDALRGGAASLRGKTMLHASGSVESAALSLAGSSNRSPHGTAIKSEGALMIEEWEARRAKAVGALNHADDVAPSEFRLRMRLEELQQRCLMDLLEHHHRLSERSVPDGSSTGFQASPLQERGGWHREKRRSLDGAAASPGGSKPLNPVDPKGRRRM